MYNNTTSRHNNNNHRNIIINNLNKRFKMIKRYLVHFKGNNMIK